jgi:hypothetical protein
MKTATVTEVGLDFSRVLRAMKYYGSNRRLVPPQRGGLGLFFDGSLCLTWGGYPETLATCRAPCEGSILAPSTT